MKRSLLLAIVLFCAEILFAQKGKEEAGIIFNPHWYLQLQGGMGYTVGETGFKDLISPAGALSVGYSSRLSGDFAEALAVGRVRVPGRNPPGIINSTSFS